MISKKAAQCLLHTREGTHKCRISNMFIFSFINHITVRSIGLLYTPDA